MWKSASLNANAHTTLVSFCILITFILLTCNKKPIIQKVLEIGASSKTSFRFSSRLSCNQNEERPQSILSFAYFLTLVHNLDLPSFITIPKKYCCCRSLYLSLLSYNRTSKEGSSTTKYSPRTSTPTRRTTTPTFEKPSTPRPLSKSIAASPVVTPRRKRSSCARMLSVGLEPLPEEEGSAVAAFRRGRFPNMTELTGKAWIMFASFAYWQKEGLF